MSKGVLMEPETLPTARVSKHELRTRETRELLLKAAETIFTRDGYEGTDLNDIAELAGRTKGAIYGHFKSKEEIFLALIAEHRFRYRRRIDMLLTDDVQENIRVMRSFVRELAVDKEWALLQLEFKLFTLRHPEAKERFQSIYAEVIPDREQIYEKLVGPVTRERHPVSRTLALHSMIPMLSALLLESEFDPNLMTRESIQTLITSVFDCLIGVS